MKQAVKTKKLVKRLNKRKQNFAEYIARAQRDGISKYFQRSCETYLRRRNS